MVMVSVDGDGSSLQKDFSALISSLGLMLGGLEQN